MTRRPDTRQITDVVRTTLSSDFPDARIVDVRVFESDELDDEGFLKITMVFEGEPTNLDARKTAGAVRRVRPKLAEIGEEAFPLLSFVSERDAGQLEPNVT